MSEEGVTRREFFRQNYGAVGVSRGNMPKAKKHTRFLQCPKMPQSVGPCFCNFVARYTIMAIVDLQTAVFDLICSAVTVVIGFAILVSLYTGEDGKFASLSHFHTLETYKSWLVD